MKCPVCGDEVRNGKCLFCGYRPTEEDRTAREKYERQKAGFGQAPRAGPSRYGGKPDPDAGPGRAPVPKPGRKPAAKPERKPAAKPRKDRRAHARDGKPGPGGRPGRLKRILFKLVVIGWALLYLALIAQKLARDSRQTGPPPAQAEQSAGYGRQAGPGRPDHPMEGGT